MCSITSVSDTRDTIVHQGLVLHSFHLLLNQTPFCWFDEFIINSFPKVIKKLKTSLNTIIRCVVNDRNPKSNKIENDIIDRK
jgi:hypothetical protein